MLDPAPNGAEFAALRRRVEALEQALSRVEAQVATLMARPPVQQQQQQKPVPVAPARPGPGGQQQQQQQQQQYPPDRSRPSQHQQIEPPEPWSLGPGGPEGRRP